MATATIDGIETHYEVTGAGPPLLMYAPGGFDATIEKWSSLGVYARIRLLEHLPEKYTCIAFDRRETGRSGGRVERVTWRHFVAQGVGLLDHLDIDRAHLIGGCMGCCPVTAFAVAYPGRVASMILYWPVGGARFRLNAHMRFSRHLAFVEENGLAAVVELVRSHEENFSADPRGGPWGAVIRRDEAFADAYAAQDVDDYKLIVAGTARCLFDRDTAPGAEPEDMLRCPVPALIVPGNDASHATSAARYLAECLPESDYWDVPVDEQREDNVPARIMEFLSGVSG